MVRQCDKSYYRPRTLLLERQQSRKRKPKQEKENMLKIENELRKMIEEYKNTHNK